MKLTEAILLESFGDLKRIMRDAFIEVSGDTRISGSNVATLKKNDPGSYSSYHQLIASVKKAQQQGVEVPKVQLNTADGIFEILKWIMKHPYIVNNWRGLTDTGRWIKMLRDPSNGLSMALRTMENIIPKIVVHETDPNRQKPDLQTIKKTPKYEVYKLNNYMAARKVCNTFNTTFCIGADPGWFDNYGSNKGRDTYAITLPNKTVVIVHSGDSGFLITDHANKADVSHTGSGRGPAERGISADFIAAGLNEREAVEALSLVIPRKFHSDVAEMMKSAFSNEQNTVIYSNRGVKAEEIKKGFSIKISGPKSEIYLVLAGSGFILSDSSDFDMSIRRDPAGTIAYLEDHVGLDRRHLTAMIGSMYEYGGEPDRMAAKLDQVMFDAMFEV